MQLLAAIMTHGSMVGWQWVLAAAPGNRYASESPLAVRCRTLRMFPPMVPPTLMRSCGSFSSLNLHPNFSMDTLLGRGPGGMG